MIPKIIHQSYKTVEHPYPRIWQQSWVEAHADWIYRFYTDADNRQIVNDNFPQYLGPFDAFPKGIMRADFSRFLYMYLWGGVYVDLDYVCLKPCDILLAKSDPIGIPELPQNRHYRYHNALLISESENPFWLKCADRSMQYFMSAKPARAEWLAGPFRIQAAIKSERPRFVSLSMPDVTPIDWFSCNSNFGKVNKEIVDLRRKLRSGSIDDMRKAFPDAYALTFWEHRW